MSKIANMQQAADYVYDQLKEVNTEIRKEDVYDTILDEVLESVEYALTDEDIKFVEDNIKTPEAIDEYLKTKIPEYQDLLDDIVVDMIGEEIMGE